MPYSHHDNRMVASDHDIDTLAIERSQLGKWGIGAAMCQGVDGHRLAVAGIEDELGQVIVGVQHTGHVAGGVIELRGPFGHCVDSDGLPVERIDKPLRVIAAGIGDLHDIARGVKQGGGVI
jgi:hypothetical protein